MEIIASSGCCHPSFGSDGQGIGEGSGDGAGSAVGSPRIGLAKAANDVGGPVGKTSDGILSLSPLPLF